MAALRDIARDFAAEIRDGIGWTIVYRTGRSWNALTIWSDIWNGEWETDDLNDAIGILKADPDAVIVNGYYCGHFGEDMTIDEIAAGIRWHYEGGRNRLADYCEVTQGRDALEEGRKAAEAAGLPFCERLADEGDNELSPYVYDGSMTLADREKMQQAREAFEKLADALREIAAKLAEALKADKLVFLTDVDGIRMDARNAKTAIDRLTAAQARELLDDGLIQGGMVPKLRSCVRALDNGVEKVVVLDGRIDHVLLLDAVSGQTMGTTIRRN